MKNQNLRKLFLVVLGLFFFSGVKVFSKTSVKKEYWAIRNVNINTLGPSQRALLHKKMTKILVHLDAIEKKPNFYKGSKFSYQKILNELTGSVIPFCHAEEEANHCLFGGWVSVRSGRCNTPYSRTGQAAAAAAGTSQYDSSAYCNDRSLFRCNPLVFGPGIDPAKAGDDYPNVNGNANNGAPYEAGICVDISGGFNGLSEKCQRASEHLDTLRDTPWRESNFFTEERVEDFKALQGVIADRCEANREVINADKMCDSLEKSLGLTATAATAGKINGINIEDIIPQCAELVGAGDEAESCERSERPTLSKLYEALEEVNNLEGCQFGRVQAIDKASSMDRIYAEPSSCPVAIRGNLVNGITTSDSVIVLQVRGLNGDFSGQVEITTNVRDTKEQILEKIQSHSNFTNSCNISLASSCNLPDSSNVDGTANARIIAQLNQLKNSRYDKGLLSREKSCNIDGLNVGAAHETDNVILSKVKGPGREGPAQCPVHFTGEVKELFDTNQFGAGSEEGVGMTITFHKGGSLITIPHTVRASNIDSLAEEIQNNKQFKEFCETEASPTENEQFAAEVLATLDATKLRSDLGLNPGQYLSPNLSRKLASISNIEGLSVEIDEFGQVRMSLKELSEDERTKVLSVFPQYEAGRVYNPETQVLTYSTHADRVDFLANRTEVVLTENERSDLESLHEASLDFSGGLHGLARNSDGSIVFTTIGESPSARADFESFSGHGLIIEPVVADRSETSEVRSYTFREEVEATDLAVSLDDVGTVSTGDEEREPAAANDSLESGLEDVMGIAPASGGVSLNYESDLSKAVAAVNNADNVSGFDISRGETETHDGKEFQVFNVNFGNMLSNGKQESAISSVFQGSDGQYGVAPHPGLMHVSSGEGCERVPATWEEIRRAGSFRVHCPRE